MARDSAKKSVRRYRERLRAQGLRPIQIWVPDTRSPKFVSECRRQSLLVAKDPAEKKLMDELHGAVGPVEDWQP